MSYVSIDVEDVKTGEVFDDLVLRRELPEIGAEFDSEVGCEPGKTRRVRRVIVPPQEHVTHRYEEIVGWTLPTLKQAKARGLVRAPRYDAKGRPVFNSRREIADYEHRVNDSGKGHQIRWER